MSLVKNKNQVDFSLQNVIVVVLLVCVVVVLLYFEFFPKSFHWYFFLRRNQFGVFFVVLEHRMQ